MRKGKKGDTIRGGFNPLVFRKENYLHTAGRESFRWIIAALGGIG